MSWRWMHHACLLAHFRAAEPAAAPREGTFFTQQELDDLLRRTFEDGQFAARVAARVEEE